MSIPEPELNVEAVRHQIGELRRSRDAHQMDESDYVEAILALIQQVSDQRVRNYHNHYSGQPEEHSTPCEDCGSTFWIDYLLPHPVFNAVCPGGKGYLCLPCFANRMTDYLSHKEAK